MFHKRITWLFASFNTFNVNCQARSCFTSSTFNTIYISKSANVGVTIISITMLGESYCVNIVVVWLNMDVHKVSIPDMLGWEAYLNYLWLGIFMYTRLTQMVNIWWANTHAKRTVMQPSWMIEWRCYIMKYFKVHCICVTPLLHPIRIKLEVEEYIPVLHTDTYL